MQLNPLTYREVLAELRAEYAVRAKKLREGAARMTDAHSAAALRGRARGYEEAAQALDSLLAHGRVAHWPGGMPPSLAAVDARS